MLKVTSQKASYIKFVKIFIIISLIMPVFKDTLNSCFDPIYKEKSTICYDAELNPILFPKKDCRTF